MKKHLKKNKVNKIFFFNILQKKNNCKLKIMPRKHHILIPFLLEANILTKNNSRSTNLNHSLSKPTLTLQLPINHFIAIYLYFA